jgi:hypothetical protein
MRGTKQDIRQRAIRTPSIAVRNCRNSAPTGNLPRPIRVTLAIDDALAMAEHVGV